MLRKKQSKETIQRSVLLLLLSLWVLVASMKVDNKATKQTPWHELELRWCSVPVQTQTFSSLGQAYPGFPVSFWRNAEHVALLYGRCWGCAKHWRFIVNKKNKEELAGSQVLTPQVFLPPHHCCRLTYFCTGPFIAGWPSCAVCQTSDKLGCPWASPDEHYLRCGSLHQGCVLWIGIEL